MLALAIAMLHDPAVLMIDELSLGLAPIIVQELIEVIDGLKAAGVTLIIVEQSLNVAAAIADRAVFLEKGHVRFEGQIRDLMERDDLARAVFLGGQEGRLMLAVTWINSQIVFDGVVQGLGDRRHRRRRGPRLPGHPDHQLRRRQHGRGRRRRPARSWSCSTTCRSGWGWSSPWSWGWPSEPSSTWRSSAGCASRPASSCSSPPSACRSWPWRSPSRSRPPPRSPPTIRAPSTAPGRWPASPSRGSDLSILIIVPITLIALTWFLDRTTLGRTVKACASNPRLARLSGISPKMVSTMVWALAAGAVHALGRPDRRSERRGGGPDDARAHRRCRWLWSPRSSAA